MRAQFLVGKIVDRLRRCIHEVIGIRGDRAVFVGHAKYIAHIVHPHDGIEAPMESVDVVLFALDAPIDGAGRLWKAIDGEPAFRRIIHVTRSAPLGDVNTSSANTWTGHQVFGEPAEPPTGAQALLMVGQEGGPGYEEEFRDWMMTEHVPNLSAVPGVLYAARYEAVKGSPGSFALYYVESTDVFQSDAWKKASKTPWGARMGARPFPNRVRGLYAPA